MSEKILVPALGESVTEATVSKWLKNQGDKVVADEPLVELETDKVNIEVPSPSNGVLDEIKIREGQTVNVGATLGKVGSSTVSKDKKDKKKYSPPPVQKKKIETDDEAEPIILQSEKTNEEIQPLLLKNEEKEEYVLNEKSPLVLGEFNEKRDFLTKEKILSPAARKMAAESKVNVEEVEGTGKNGVILKEDIMSLMGTQPSPSQRKITHGPEERIKMTRLRMTIAKRLKEAQENAAMLTTFNEVNMHEIISMRKNYQDDFQKKYSTKLGFMSFFVKACVIGLKNYPAINAEIQGNEIVYKNYYNVSIAVGTERGLVVPVVKNADEMSFADIEKNISLLGQKARDGKITIEDLQ